MTIFNSLLTMLCSAKQLALRGIYTVLIFEWEYYIQKKASALKRRCPSTYITSTKIWDLQDRLMHEG